MTLKSDQNRAKKWLAAQGFADSPALADEFAAIRTEAIAAERKRIVTLVQELADYADEISAQYWTNHLKALEKRILHVKRGN